MGNIKDKVAIIGMGISKFGENFRMSDEDMLVDACYEAYNDAGIDPNDIEAGWIGTTMTGCSGSVLSRAINLHNKPVTRVENACASGAEAVRNAAFAIASGMYDIALATGVEKQKDTGFQGLDNPPGSHPVYIQFIGTGPGLYALAATRYFHKYGLSPEEGKRTLAKIAVKNHHNGTMSPNAHFKREVTIEQVMNAPIMAWPLGLFDCCPVTDGASAAILVRADLAKNFCDDYVLIKGTEVAVSRRDLYHLRIIPDYDYTFWEQTDVAARKVYEQIGIKDPRKEISIANVHDCFTISELTIYEALGFSPLGKAREDVDSGFFTMKGGLPVNTDGGLKSFGHPIGASGIRMMYEIFKQLQGKAGPRQIKNPTLGLAHSQGGNPGAFQCSVTILGARD